MMHIIGIADFKNEKISNEIRQCYEDNNYDADVIEWIGVGRYPDDLNFERCFNKDECDSFFERQKDIKRKKIVLLLCDDSGSNGNSKYVAYYPSCSKKYLKTAIDQLIQLRKNYQSLDNMPKDNFSKFSNGFTIGTIVLATVSVIIYIMTAL